MVGNRRDEEEDARKIGENRGGGASQGSEEAPSLESKSQKDREHERGHAAREHEHYQACCRLLDEYD